MLCQLCPYLVLIPTGIVQLAPTCVLCGFLDFYIILPHIWNYFRNHNCTAHRQTNVLCHSVQSLHDLIQLIDMSCHCFESMMGFSFWLRDLHYKQESRFIARFHTRTSSCFWKDSWAELHNCFFFKPYAICTYVHVGSFLRLLVINCFETECNYVFEAFVQAKHSLLWFVDQSAMFIILKQEAGALARCLLRKDPNGQLKCSQCGRYVHGASCKWMLYEDSDC